MKSYFATMPFIKNRRTLSVLVLTWLSFAAAAQTPSQPPPQTPPQPPTQTPPQTPTQAQPQTPAQAQDQTLPKMRFGMKIQPALNWLSSSTEGTESNGTEFRFAWGGVAEFKFGERYYFSTGIDVANRGGSIRKTETFSDSIVITDHNMKLRYIELPLTMKMKTNEIGYLCYYLQFGLAPGFNMRSVADITTTTQTSAGTATAKDEKVDISDKINFFNLSIVIGLGAEWRFSGSTTLIGGLTYSNGFPGCSFR
jgi:hypothetical protein